MDIIIGLVGGIVVGWAGGYWYYKKGKADLEREATRLRLQIGTLDVENTDLAKRLKDALGKKN